MRLTWRKRSAATRKLLVVVLVLVTLFFVVVIGERDGLPSVSVGHRASPEVGDLPVVQMGQFIRHRRCRTPGQWSGDHQADVTSRSPLSQRRVTATIRS